MSAEGCRMHERRRLEHGTQTIWPARRQRVCAPDCLRLRPPFRATLQCHTLSDVVDSEAGGAPSLKRYGVVSHIMCLEREQKRTRWKGGSFIFLTPVTLHAVWTLCPLPSPLTRAMWYHHAEAFAIDAILYVYYSSRNLMFVLFQMDWNIISCTLSYAQTTQIAASAEP